MSYERRAGQVELGTRPLHHQPRKLTGLQRDQIIRRYLNGETAKALAVEFGVSVRGLQSYLPRRD